MVRNYNFGNQIYGNNNYGNPYWFDHDYSVRSAYTRNIWEMQFKYPVQV